MKIGIFGESPYDTDAMIALLEKRHDKVRVIPMIKNLRGSQMLSQKALDLFESEMELQSDLKVVIAMRDLDGPASNAEKVKEVREWYAKFEKRAYCRSILLLHIQEIEALLLIDTTVVNKTYGCSVKAIGNPEHKEKPKEHLEGKTLNKDTKNHYKESDISKLFKQLNFDNLLKVPYFKTFHQQLEDAMKPPSKSKK